MKSRLLAVRELLVEGRMPGSSFVTPKPCASVGGL